MMESNLSCGVTSLLCYLTSGAGAVYTRLHRLCLFQNKKQ